MNNRRTIILGGGTFEPIRNHLALCAPAFGTTAIKLNKLIPNSELILTKMVDRGSKIVSNDDVAGLIDGLILDPTVGTIILNIAFSDFKTKPINGVENGFHADRLETAKGDLTVELTPTEKIISTIRQRRPDIFLVGFKTTTNKGSEDQFAIALKMMKSSKCNLVLANDTVTRNNMVITAEESIYGETTNREDVLKELAEITIMRSNLTYNPSKFISGESFPMSKCPNTFQEVVKFLVMNGGFIENNGNGFTPGHFCYRNSDNSFYSSQRKANHNLVFSEGLSLVSVINDEFIVSGSRKASVGARSQWLILSDNPGYDCIIHTHNPLKEDSFVPIVEQRPFQCGSLECGLNTVQNMEFVDGIRMAAVYLNKHGINLLFRSNSNPNRIIQFLKDNIVLGKKIK